MKGRTEIDDTTWVAIYQQQVAQYINNGIWLDEAQHLARELMDSVYVARPTALQCESQHDCETEAATHGVSMRDYMRGPR